MMPGFDGTGPMGTGPIGRRMGPCSNSVYSTPVYQVNRWNYPFRNVFYGFGRRFGRGFGAAYGRGFGMGRGYGRGYGRGWW